MKLNNQKRLAILMITALTLAPSAWSKNASPSSQRRYLSNETQLPLIQQLVVRQIDSSKISFIIATRLKWGKEYSISGIAIRAIDRANEDAEIDDDQESGAYAVNIYSFTRGECSLEIRIEEEKKSKATILESGCGALHPSNVPFETRTVITTRKLRSPKH